MADLETLKARVSTVPGGEMVAVYAETVRGLIGENERLREALWRIKWGSGTGETARLLKATEMQSIAEDALEGVNP